MNFKRFRFIISLFLNQLKKLLIDIQSENTGHIWMLFYLLNAFKGTVSGGSINKELLAKVFFIKIYLENNKSDKF